MTLTYWSSRVTSSAYAAPIRIYDGHGIALEAHQQNALLEFGSTGMPAHSYCRDIQGLALSESFRERSIELVPELEAQHKVFEDDAIVRQGIGYYLFFNQVIAVIHRFGVDGLLNEDELVAVAQEKLRALRSNVGQLGLALIDGLLESETIPFKGNLLTRIADMDELQSENELAVYLRIENPLRAGRPTRTLPLQTPRMKRVHFASPHLTDSESATHASIRESPSSG